MKSFNNLSNALFTLLLTLTLLLPFSSHASVDVLFSPNGGVNDRISIELKSAEKSVDIAMYSFSHKGLLKQIKALAQNGIRVRLVLNKAHQSEEKSTDLENSGVDVRYVNLIMHHKFAIIDGPADPSSSTHSSTLMTGSQNWSNSADTRYDEDFLVFKAETKRIKSFQSEFNHMWNHSRDFAGEASFGEDATKFPFNSNFSLFTSSNFYPKIYRGQWSFRKAVSLSEGVAGSALIEAIESAQTSIKIATAHFRRKDIHDAIVKAMNRGIKVTMILDAQEFNSRAELPPPVNNTTSLDENLSKLGAVVKYKFYSRYWRHPTAKQMHAKYLIVDDALVLTGSFNWSENAELKTLENLLLLKGEQTPSYLQNFNKILNYREGELSDLVKEIESQNGYGPCHFSPITLTGKNISKVKRQFARGACRTN